MTEQTYGLIPVAGIIHGSGDVHIDPDLLAYLDARPHPVGIGGCIWTLLPAETRQLLTPHIFTRDDAGVWCSITGDLEKQILPEIGRASRRRVIRPGIDYAEFERYLDLVHHQDEMGIPLAVHPVLVAQIESEGGMVDLGTGEIVWLRDEEEQEGD